MVEATSIIGSPEDCSTQMKKFFSNGVTEIRLVLNIDTSENFKNTLTQLAPYI